MASTIDVSPSWDTLAQILQRVRARWRLRVVLHGLTIVAAAAMILLIGGAWVMNALHFGTAIIITLRIVAYAVLIGVTVRYIVLPLRRHPTDQQIALYLEEHHPSLDALVLSATDARAHDAPAFVRSPRLVQRVAETAVSRVHATGDGADLESRSIATSLSVLGAMAIATALLIALGPEFLRTGAHLLAAPTSDAHGNVYIGVKPGDTEVSRGGDQAIRAELHGFTAGDAMLVMQRGAGKWERIPMTALRDSGAFVVRLFDLRERTTYYVESEGLRSPTYHLDVVNLPYVKALTLELHYPTYTGLPVKTVENGGDIAVPRGTTVRVRATTTMPVARAWLVVDGQPRIPMTVGTDGVLSASMTVTANGFYKIELAAGNGSPVPGSLNYTIDVLDDTPPTITFLKPGRDMGVDSLAEVFSQVEATDDYGVANVQLHYALNGGPEQTVSLHNGEPRKDVIAGYTFFLKSLNVKPGDVISYYAQASDNDTPAGGQVSKTDIYFLNVRPHYEYRKGQQQNGQQQQQQDQKSPGELIRKQRQIVAGTYKVDRDRARIAPQTLTENMTTLSLAQSQLRDQVDQIGQQIFSRGLAAGDTMFQMILDEVTSASKEMSNAEAALTARDARAALGPEQRALQHLQRAEAANRIREVQQSQRANPEEQEEEDPSKELADLFQLDKKQLGDQFETRRPETPRKTDELAQKLKELAERQQRARELQAQRQAQQQGQQGQQGQQQQQQQQQQASRSSDGGEQQRQIARDAEQMANRLEQMSQGNEGSQTFRQTAQQLRSAAQDMRRAATGENPEDAAKAAAKLDAAQQTLAEQSQTPNARQDPKHQLLNRTHELMRVAQSLDDRLNNEEQGGRQQTAQSQQSGGQERQHGEGGQNPQQNQQAQPNAEKSGQSKSQQGKQPGTERGPQQQLNQGEGEDPSNPQQSRGGAGAPPKDTQRQTPSNYGWYGGSNDMQQLSREFRAQREQAEALQRDVQRQGGDTRGLSQIIDNMRALEGQAGKDRLAPELQTSVVDGLKNWEFGFRRSIEGAGKQQPVLGENADVPSGYRALVEEYYRSLSKQP